MLARSLTAAFGLLALSATAFAEEQTTADNPVVAVVNGKELHRSDVESIARSLPEQMRQVPLEQIYPMLLDRVIDFKLLADEAETLNIADDPEVQPALAEARANVLRDAMLRKKVEEGSTKDKLQARYEEMKKGEDFSFEEVHARHILLASEDDANKVIAELENGAEFEELAKERSTGPSAAQGGDLGYFKKGQMVPEFGEAAFAMEIGSTSSEPVKTQFGYHVIKVEDKRTVEPSFEESEPQIRQEVARDIVTALVEELRSNAKIERFNIDGTPMVAKEVEDADGDNPEQPKDGG